MNQTLTFHFEQAARGLKTKLLFPDPLKAWGGASIDTRTLKSGEVFFALKGERQDGHQFLWEAFRRGAAGAVLSEEFLKKNREPIFRERALFHNLLPVHNPEEALAECAKNFRREFSCVGVGVTGSVGKTGTKEFLRFLLNQKYPVLASRGNLNNHLGLPLTLFQLKPEHQYCVAELGASRRGEIRRLASILNPKVGIVTGISPCHLEGFGTLNDIYEAKLELADALARQKGTLILPDHDPELANRARKRKVALLFWGRKKSSDFRMTGLEVSEGWVEFEVNDRWRFKFPGNAGFQAENALAALAASFVCGISPREFPSIWSEIDFPAGRFQVIRSEVGVTFINDSYNANPYSFARSLEAFEALPGGGRKILVLADMLELGSESREHHRQLGEQVSRGNFHALLTFGDWIRETSLVAEAAGNPPLTLHFEDKEFLIHFLSNYLKAGDQVLFKGSRGMKLERVLSVLSRPLSVKRLHQPF